MWSSAPNKTPILDSFLSSIVGLIQSRDGAKLQDFLQIEPPLSPIYREMIGELRRSYPRDGGRDEQLLTKCEELLPSAGTGSPWSAFPIFLRLYLMFLRDVNVDNLLETYDLLKGLLNQCVLALGDSQMGIIVLPTVLYLSKVLAKLAMGLDRRPELVAHLMREGAEPEPEETIEKITLVEKAANVVREAFIKCLTDRSGAAGPHGKPEGKRMGIYLMANLCLKLLFKCGKLRNAEQMFASINAQSPPLSYFPASQRVTYLYYLGRYLFSNNLFFPAQTALQAAYDQCHREAVNQRRLILTYLIPCNMILGRFPSADLLRRPESEGLAGIFIPICRLIASGDIAGFRTYLAVDSPHADWLARTGVLLQLRNRCEILVWRSLARKVFILAGFHGDQKTQAQRGPPPFLYLRKLEAAIRWLESRSSDSILPQTNLSKQSMLDAAEGDGARPSQGDLKNSRLLSFLEDWDFAMGKDIDAKRPLASDYGDYMKPEAYFDQTGQLIYVTGPDSLPDELVQDTDHPEPSQARDPALGSSESIINQGNENDPESPTLLMRDIESILASLLTQDLMRGYLTHLNPRFAIPGARVKGALPTGFPNVWHTISARERKDELVPGWVKAPPNPFGVGTGNLAAGPFGGMGGRVVNLSGARPVSAMRG